MVVECCFDVVGCHGLIVVFETDLAAGDNVVVDCIVEFVVELADCIDCMNCQMVVVGN